MVNLISQVQRAANGLVTRTDCPADVTTRSLIPKSHVEREMQNLSSVLVKRRGPMKPLDALPLDAKGFLDCAFLSRRDVLSALPGPHFLSAFDAMCSAVPVLGLAIMIALHELGACFLLHQCETALRGVVIRPRGSTTR